MFFSKYASDARGVWAAFRERSYEGICFICRGYGLGDKAKADVRRYYKKCTYASKASIFYCFDRFYLSIELNPSARREFSRNRAY